MPKKPRKIADYSGSCKVCAKLHNQCSERKKRLSTLSRSLLIQDTPEGMKVNGEFIAAEQLSEHVDDWAQDSPHAFCVVEGEDHE